MGNKHDLIINTFRHTHMYLYAPVSQTKTYIDINNNDDRVTFFQRSKDFKVLDFINCC